MLRSLPSLKETITKYDLMAKKSLGQNFLLDQNITDKIVRSSLDKQGLKDFSQDNVTEIGPGPGGLTRAILKAKPKHLSVIEMDNRCIKIMNELKEHTDTPFEIINQDALKTPITEGHIVSNLPYNISVPLLIGWIKNINRYKSLTLMFQKEVAERIVSETNSKDYGRISILSQLTCKIDKLFDISPECFTPAPKIWSTVLLFRPLDKQPSESQINKIENLTAQAFGQRRKMIRQSLKSVPNLEDICLKLNINLTDRAENLSPSQFLSLVDNIR